MSGSEQPLYRHRTASGHLGVGRGPVRLEVAWDWRKKAPDLAKKRSTWAGHGSCLTVDDEDY